MPISLTDESYYELLVFMNVVAVAGAETTSRVIVWAG